MAAVPASPGSARALAFALLACSNLLWAGNWVIGRALRDAVEPITLNFLRWLVAALVLAPFAWPAVVAHRAVIRRHLGLLVLLALTGVVLFQLLVYVGLRTTTTVNAVLLNSAGPLFMVLCSWVLEREHATRGQIIGMLISLVGIVVIMVRGDLGLLRQFELHAGDGWILLAMLMWGIYSVLLKRRPPEVGGVLLLFVITLAGVAMMLPMFLVGLASVPQRMLHGAEIAAVVYVGLGASLGAFICWNKGVSIVGANAAGVSLHLLPAFGTLLAIMFLDESFQLFHAAGITTILIGVVIASRRAK